MKISVTAQVPMDRFKSGWEDRDEAAQEFTRYAREEWAKDLAPLVTLGLQIDVQIDTVPTGKKAAATEVKVAPYEPEAFDMMQKTRELLTDEKELWDKFCKSPKANMLYA